MRANLEIVLGLKLIPKPSVDTTTESDDIECAICYTHAIPRIGSSSGGIGGSSSIPDSSGGSASTISSSSSYGIIHTSTSTTTGNVSLNTRVPAVQFNLPDQLCSNPKCNRVYHTDCLIQWLQALPSTRSSYGTLFGVCPYCTEGLAVKVTNC